jgi:hypothetical protein
MVKAAYLPTDDPPLVPLLGMPVRSAILKASRAARYPEPGPASRSSTTTWPLLHLGIRGVVVDRSEIVSFLGLGGRLDDRLLWPFGVHIALSVGIQLELGAVVEVISRFVTVAGLFDRLF